ncbi:MAG TPA: Lrp/AsnC ligand binding domain-containing protein [Actinomycetota bacterium]|nr:Lrp/AsnC ligand binding domain-containing protein [Actinomycetota bacterium]
MDAYVYVRAEPGKVVDVLNGLSAKPGVRRGVVVVGNWDLLVHAEGPDLSTIASVVLSEMHNLPGVVATTTAPVVPPDRIGVTGFGGPKPPPIVPNACYVHIKAEAGAAAGIAERLGDVEDVAGVAVLAGEWDLLACIAHPWEIGSGVIIEQVHPIPGIVGTSTLVSVVYEESDPDRDQFSTWS